MRNVRVRVERIVCCGLFSVYKTERKGLSVGGALSLQRFTEFRGLPVTIRSDKLETSRTGGFLTGVFLLGVYVERPGRFVGIKNDDLLPVIGAKVFFGLFQSFHSSLDSHNFPHLKRLKRL